MARRRTLLAAGVALALLGGLLPAQAQDPLAAAVDEAHGFELVGHDPIFGRGMNAAPALYSDTATGRTFVYVGSRTDSSNNHPHPGVAILETTDPSNPHVVGEIGAPHEGNIGETSRELRVWPAAKLLLVLHFTCSSIIHACDPATDNVTRTAPNIVFYDLSDPANPTPAFVYETGVTPHEIFLWEDPVNAGRALLYMSVPSSSTQAANLVVVDISSIAASHRTAPTTLAQWSANADIDAAARRSDDVRLHSMGISPDGTRAYLAYLGAGFLVLDTSPLTNPEVQPPVALVLKTATADRADWGNPGTHTSVHIPFTRTVDGVERKYALTTDEVYGDAITPLQLGKGKHGCPWGWVRTLDITDEAHPTVVGEYKIAENDPSSCATMGAGLNEPSNPSVPPTPAYVCDVAEGFDPTASPLASYSSHNPTVLRDLAFVTWHGGGLQAIDLSEPVHPSQAGVFKPAPLSSVATEDPALSSGLTKVVMWSYPILHRQGDATYIYVLDVRNGLYVLRYTGPHADSVDDVSFLEGNSNLGDAPALDGFVPPTGPPPTGEIPFGATTSTDFHFDSALPVGDASRVAEFGAVDDGPKLTRSLPTGTTKVQTFSRFGNAGLAANPLLAYFSYADPMKIDGAPELRLWLSAPGAPGVVRTPVTVELFIDGTPRYGAASATGSWVPRSFSVDVGPNPTEVVITLPELHVTALDSVLVQLGVRASTDGAPAAALLYGSAMHDSMLRAPVGLPTT